MYASHSGIHSKVTSNAGKMGGLRIKVTDCFMGSGLLAPACISVSGLTEKELDPVLCPSGFLATQVPGLCKGGNDVFSNGGLLVSISTSQQELRRWRYKI